MNIKLAHESPISIFDTVQKATDYDYALVHLLDENSEYRKKFEKAKADGRMIYLDTSIFELGTAFDPVKFAGWVKRLEPDYYFVPDVLEDGYETMRQMSEWNYMFKGLPGKKVGVVQGRDLVEIMDCYRYMDMHANVDMIAFSFDYSYYEELFPSPNKHVSWAMGRVMLLNKLLELEVINTSKKHHLLGCSLPLEFRYYREFNYEWIYSIDTSNPVVHSIKGIRYEENLGLMKKDSQKLFEMINYPADQIDQDTLVHNLYQFRRIVNGTANGWNV